MTTVMITTPAGNVTATIFPANSTNHEYPQDGQMVAADSPENAYLIAMQLNNGGLCGFLVSATLTQAVRDAQGTVRDLLAFQEQLGRAGVAQCLACLAYLYCYLPQHAAEYPKANVDTLAAFDTIGQDIADLARGVFADPSLNAAAAANFIGDSLKPSFRQQD